MEKNPLHQVWLGTSIGRNMKDQYPVSQQLTRGLRDALSQKMGAPLLPLFLLITINSETAFNLGGNTEWAFILSLPLKRTKMAAINPWSGSKFHVNYVCTL